MQTNPIYRPLIRNFVAWMFLGCAGFFGLTMIAAAGDYDKLEPAGKYIIQFLVFLPLIWFLGKHIRGRLPIQYFFTSNYAPYRTIDLVQVFLLVLVVIYGLEGLTSRLWLTLHVEMEDSLFSEGETSSLKIFTVFFTAFLVPFMEELVFRGLILQRMMVRWNWKIALIGSSLCFGILHFENAVSASLFGGIMGILYLQTRNLWVPVIMHILNNLILITWLILLPELSRPEHLLWEYLSIIFGLPFLYHFLRKFMKTNQPDQVPYEFHWKHQARKENFVPYTKAPLE